MTRIERLEMQGFKSFAKKTIVNFPSNFSVIAGPNGSGKSNVIDGLCFVLGRTSAKSLRADKMMEMIFRGGKSKSRQSSPGVSDI
jgi:chromosome segregation protein